MFLTEALHALEKTAHRYIIFHTFKCSNASSPNSWSYFSNFKFKVYSNFVSLFSVMKDDSYVLFYLEPHTFLTKIIHRSEICRLFSGLLKTHQISLSCLKLKVSFSLKFTSLFNVNFSVAHHSTNLQTFDCSREISPNFFFDLANLIYLNF